MFNPRKHPNDSFIRKMKATDGSTLYWGTEDELRKLAYHGRAEILGTTTNKGGRLEMMIKVQQSS